MSSNPRQLKIAQTHHSPRPTRTDPTAGPRLGRHPGPTTMAFGKRPSEIVHTPWVVIETLAPGAASVVSVGGAERDFAPVDRIVQRLIRTHHLARHVTTEEVMDPIQAARETGEEIDRPVNGGLHVVRVRPIFGPNQHLHGVQFWIGLADEEAPEPRRVVGVVWDLPTRTMHQTLDGHLMAGLTEETFTPAVPIAVFWNRALRFDDREAVLDLLYCPRMGAKIRTTGSIRIGDDTAVIWQATIRSRRDRQCIGAWGLLEDIAAERPAPRPTMEQTAFRDYHRIAGNHLALIDVQDAAIVYWLTDPPAEIAWRKNPGELFAPKDRARVTAAAQTRSRIEVGVRTGTRQYIPATIALSAYGGRCNRNLAVVEFELADGPDRRPQ